MIDWFLAPISGASQHQLAPWAAWHARCMVLGWGLLLPLGVLAARYLKVLPGQQWPQQLDNKAWWHAHRALQWAGMAAVTIGAYLAWGKASSSSWLGQMHSWLGWTVIIAGWFQVAGGLLRGTKGGPTEANARGDHYDMTAYRIWFERIHKTVGWLAVFLACGVLAMGMFFADAPRWMPAVIAIWWAILILMAIRMQAAGQCIDTYQAIWGPDPRHPGNQKKPIGFGIRRPQI